MKANGFFANARVSPRSGRPSLPGGNCFELMLKLRRSSRRGFARHASRDTHRIEIEQAHVEEEIVLLHARDVDRKRLRAGIEGELRLAPRDAGVGQALSLSGVGQPLSLSRQAESLHRQAESLPYTTALRDDHV